MKSLLDFWIGSLVRYGLGAFGAWVAVQSGYEYLAGDPSLMTVYQLVFGLVLVGITALLKFLDGTKYGVLGRALIGPRTMSLAASLTRLLVGAITAGLASLFQTGAFDQLEPGLSDDPVTSLVVLLCGLAYDRASKSASP